MEDYKIIVEQEHSTVMAHYEVAEKPDGGYQSEAKLEADFIRQLQSQGYEYVQVKDEAGLLKNLRRQMEKLNEYVLSDSEWARLLPMISNEQMSILDKTEMIQGKGYILNLKLDNGQDKNIKLIDKNNVHNNRLQVINQFEEEKGGHKSRYDVTILVNGLPMVHVELKRRGVDIKEAFNQINRYQRESFWAGKAMFDFVQVFVISNGTETKYYSNTTRYAKEQEASAGARKRKTDGNTILRVQCRQAAVGDATLPDSRHREDTGTHTDGTLQPLAGNHKSRWLHLAHDRQWQDADLVQDRAAGIEDGGHPQGALCGGQERPRLPDDEGV